MTVTTVIVGMIQTGAQAAIEGGLDLNAPNVFGSADAYAYVSLSLPTPMASCLVTAFIGGWGKEGGREGRTGGRDARDGRPTLYICIHTRTCAYKYACTHICRYIHIMCMYVYLFKYL